MEADKELAELEKQIEAENQRMAEEKQKVETPPVQPQAIAEAPAPVQEPVQQDTSEEPGNPAFDPKAWVEKKGWKSPEDAARSLHEMEKRFHEKNEEVRRLKEQQQYAPPPNPYAPPVPGFQPAYIPPPQLPQAPYGYQQPPAPPSRLTPEQIAASYGMDVTDFERIAQLSRDMSEATVRRQAAEFQSWKEQIDRQNEKNADMTAVLGDPAFHDSAVQKEVHDLMEKNPQLFNERRPYSTALKEALALIGRRNTIRGATSYGSVSLPTDPPKTAGSGSANGATNGRRSNVTLTPDAFKNLSLEEQEKVLKSQNAFKTYADMV